MGMPDYRESTRTVAGGTTGLVRTPGEHVAVCRKGGSGASVNIGRTGATITYEQWLEAQDGDEEAVRG